MTNPAVIAKPISVESNILWLLTLSYAMIIVFSNWFGARLVDIHGIVIGGGTLIFPFTFLLSDLITEVYGYKYARRAIWYGFLFNIIFYSYGQILTHLPSPTYAPQNATFDAMLRLDTRILFASLVSYLCAESLNSLIIAKMKMKMQGRHMGYRFVLSTMIASSVDSIIFSAIAFYGSMNSPHLLSFILTLALAKIVIEIVGLPISIKLAKALKQKEKLDMYDVHTNFSLLAFDTDYVQQANAYGKEA